MADPTELFGSGLWSAGSLSFALIFLAEFGDKSQLVCMNLAARHRALPVVLGASTAFALLNLLATLFGAALAQWIPPAFLSGFVALLFAFYGLQALRFSEEDEDTPLAEKSGASIFFSAFLLILLAELGDKTQISVAGLGTRYAPLPVWLGATLALVATSSLGAIAGRSLQGRFSLLWIHRLSGALFLALAALAVRETLRLSGPF